MKIVDKGKFFLRNLRVYGFYFDETSNELRNLVFIRKKFKICGFSLRYFQYNSMFYFVKFTVKFLGFYFENFSV